MRLEYEEVERERLVPRATVKFILFRREGPWKTRRERCVWIRRMLDNKVGGQEREDRLDHEVTQRGDKTEGRQATIRIRVGPRIAHLEDGKNPGGYSGIYGKVVIPGNVGRVGA